MFDSVEDWKIDGIVEQVNSGAVFVYPTDTLYGLGCSIYNSRSIQRVYTIKGRDKSKPVPVLATAAQAKELADFSKVESRAADKFWPGNLTLVVEAREPDGFDDRLLKRDQIALRVPDLPPLLELLSDTGPVVGTSANISGKQPPTTVESVSPFLLKEVDFVLGEVEGSGRASTVAGWEPEEGWIIHRAGELPPGKLEGLV